MAIARGGDTPGEPGPCRVFPGMSRVVERRKRRTVIKGIEVERQERVSVVDGPTERVLLSGCRLPALHGRERLCPRDLPRLRRRGLHVLRLHRSGRGVGAGDAIPVLRGRLLHLLRVYTAGPTSGQSTPSRTTELRPPLTDAVVAAHPLRSPRGPGSGGGPPRPGRRVPRNTVWFDSIISSSRTPRGNGRRLRPRDLPRLRDLAARTATPRG